MKTDKTDPKTRKHSKSIEKTKNSRKETVSNIAIEKKVPDNPESDVSVFTKTTAPKVVIQSEIIDTKKASLYQNIYKHKFLKSICLIIMSIIILMTFFLALRTYNLVNELSSSLLN